MADKKQVFPGNNVTYTITVMNGGPDDATGVTLVDELPTTATFVSTDNSFFCNESKGTVTCDFGSLPKGKSVILKITVTVNQGVLDQTITNNAEVSSNDIDRIRENNISSATTQVLGGGTPSCSLAGPVTFGTAATNVLALLTPAFTIGFKKLIKRKREK